MAQVETNGVPSENAGSDAPEFLKRLSALPYVESTWQRLAAAYETYGKANPHLGKTLDSVENMLASNATPLLKRHKDTITSFDKYACVGLDHVEGAASHVFQNIDAIRAQANERRAATTKAASDAKKAATDYTSNKLRSVERNICQASTAALRRCEHLVETALPAAAQEAPGDKTFAEMARPQSVSDPTSNVTPDDAAAAETENRDPARPVPLGEESAKLLSRTRAFSSKVQTRAYAQALQQLRFARTRSAEAVEQLRPYTVDLLKYARDHLDAMAETPEETHAADASGADASGAKDGTVSPKPSVAGSTTIGSALKRVQSARRRALRESARRLRDTIDTTAAWSFWAAASLADSSNQTLGLLRFAQTTAQATVHQTTDFALDTASSQLKHTADSVVAAYQAASGFAAAAMDQARKFQVVEAAERRANNLKGSPVAKKLQAQAEKLQAQATALLSAALDEAASFGLLPRFSIKEEEEVPLEGPNSDIPPVFRPPHMVAVAQV